MTDIIVRFYCAVRSTNRTESLHEFQKKSATPVPTLNSADIQRAVSMTIVQFLCLVLIATRQNAPSNSFTSFTGIYIYGKPDKDRVQGATSPENPKTVEVNNLPQSEPCGADRLSSLHLAGNPVL